MKKTKLILPLIFSICGIVANAQSVTIDPKANTTPVFEIKSTTEGMVMPRMTVSQRNVISGLTQGTQVYCTDCMPSGPYFWNGGTWQAMFQTTTISPTVYTIGQAAHGGIVFWLDPESSGQHGLVAFTIDRPSQNWSNNTTTAIGAWGWNIYDGKNNSDIMLRADPLGVQYQCANQGDASGVTYGEWYVPSKVELLQMYNKRAVIGNFTTNRYWSSTEWYSANSVYVDFSNGNSSSIVKTTFLLTRCIRRF